MRLGQGLSFRLKKNLSLLAKKLKLHAALEVLEIDSLFKTARVAACRQNTAPANREGGDPASLEAA